MDLQQEVEEVKKELVALIVKHLKENKIEIAKARKLAGDFLAILPVRDQQDLLLKLKDLGKEYAEARQIYIQQLGKFNEEQRSKAIERMHTLIRLGKIEDAIAVARAVQKVHESA